MWNEITGMTTHSGTLSATLGLIWFVGLVAATYAWKTRSPDHRR
jgi:ABC-type Fe3+-siderophore transport system permease subunit